MKLRYSAILIVSILIILCGCSSDDKQTLTEMEESNLSRLLDWMSGSFSSYRQSLEDTSYYSITLKMVPIWRERSDAHWLYVEQSVAELYQKPYRQRVYCISQIDDTTFESTVYELPQPLDYVGAWREEIPLLNLTPDSLIERKGCEIKLHILGDTAFYGGTAKNSCESTLHGASYATSEVFLDNKLLKSWDRGFDSVGTQVWGAEKGGYLFDKHYTAEEIPLVLDMIALDKAYIASLALTDMGHLERAKHAQESLLSTWAVFKSRYYNHTSGQTWYEYFGQIENFIINATTALESEGNPVASHELLEQVKIPMTALRNELHLDYYIDHLNAYHEIMGRLLESVKLKYGDRLDKIDLEQLGNIVMEATKRWQVVLSSDFDPSLYSFETDKTELLKKYLKAETLALEELNAVLKSGDKKAVIDAIRDLKPKFARIYKLFGDELLLELNSN